MHIKELRQLKTIARRYPDEMNVTLLGCEERELILRALILRIRAQHHDDESRAYALFLKRLVSTTSKKPGFYYQGIGTVGHLGPGNVPINALYSWAVSYWCGNNNITRISSKSGRAVIGLVESICELLSHHESREIFVSGVDGNDFLACISSICNGRILWGSDQVLEKIRQEIPIHPSVKDIFFGSKKTAALVSTQSITHIPSSVRNRIVHSLSNDFFYEYGAPCTSPSCLVSIGGDDESNNQLLQMMDEAAFLASQKYEWTLSRFSRREQEIQSTLLSEKVSDIRAGKKSDIVFLLPRIPSGRKRMDLLLEYIEVVTESEALDMIRERYNNFITYGLGDQLNKMLRCLNRVKGVQDLGKAHIFSTRWDGIDLISTLSRANDEYY